MESVRSLSCCSSWIRSSPWSSSHRCSRSTAASAPVFPVAALSSEKYASIRSPAERDSETTTVPTATSNAMNAVTKTTETTATAAPRGSRRRVRSRTSGFSVNAITADVRNRNRTCPSGLASRKTTRSSTGRTTSWIQRGIRIVVSWLTQRS